MGGHGTIEVAKTVLEVADVAWKAIETHQHHKNHENKGTNTASSEEELESLRSENQRLRNLLEQNLKLLQNLSESPSLLNDCPPDVRLYYFQPHVFLPFFLYMYNLCNFIICCWILWNSSRGFIWNWRKLLNCLRN